jgi:DNA-binding beta-propeller fold protein YncE
MLHASLEEHHQMPAQRWPSHLLPAVRRGLFAIALPLLALSAAAHTPRYALVDQWRVPGTGGWDLLTYDPPRHRLFVTRGDRVEAFNADSGALLGRIPRTAGVHGVALAPDLNRGYTSNGLANSITEFNYDTLEVVREVALPGLGPDTIVYEPRRHRLYAFNGHSSDVTVLAADTLAVVGQIALPGTPEFAVDDGQGHIHLNIESDPGALVVIDTATLAITSSWPLTGCDSPTGLAFDRSHQRLFSACANQVMVVTSAVSGQQLARVPIGGRPDGAVYDPVRHLAFSSNGVGTLTVVGADAHDRYTVATTVVTRPGARTLALDADTGRVFLVTAQFGPIPAATPEHPHPRPQPLPDTFTILVIAPN